MSDLSPAWPHPPESWRPLLPRWCSLERESAPSELRACLLDLEERGKLCPPLGDIWKSMDLVSPEEVRVVVIGQDPYHGMRQAHGLAFSVGDPLLPWPPSLRNIFKERAADLKLPVDRSSNLSDWAEQGVWLVNSVLTTQMGQAGAHMNMGWEEVVEQAMLGIMARRHRLIWVLWGKPAAQLHDRVLLLHGNSRDEDVVLKAPHPSPLSAWRGFFGSRPFSKINQVLELWGEQAIRW